MSGMRRSLADDQILFFAALQPQMGSFNLAGLKDRKKRGRGGRSLHRAASTGLFTLYQARYTDNPEPKLAGGLNRLDSGAAGGANVVHNHHACAFFLKAFNTAAHSVGLFRFAYQEAVDRRLRL